MVVASLAGNVPEIQGESNARRSPIILWVLYIYKSICIIFHGIFGSLPETNIIAAMPRKKSNAWTMIGFPTAFWQGRVISRKVGKWSNSDEHIFSDGCFLKWWYPQNTPKWSFLVGKPRFVGYHHFRKHPDGWFNQELMGFLEPFFRLPQESVRGDLGVFRGRIVSGSPKSCIVKGDTPHGFW